jgi:hypothetical protein
MRASPGLGRDVDVEQVWRRLSARRGISPQRRLIVCQPLRRSNSNGAFRARPSPTHPRIRSGAGFSGWVPPLPHCGKGCRAGRGGCGRVGTKCQVGANLPGRRRACGWRVRCSRQSEANSRLNDKNTRLPAPPCCVKELIESRDLAGVREKFAVVSGFYGKSAVRVGIVDATRFCMAWARACSRGASPQRLCRRARNSALMPQTVPRLCRAQTTRRQPIPSVAAAPVMPVRPQTVCAEPSLSENFTTSSGPSG